MPIARGVRIVFNPEMCDDFNALGDRFFACSFALRDACCTNDAFLAYFRFNVGFWDEIFAIDILMNIDRPFRWVVRARDLDGSLFSVMIPPCEYAQSSIKVRNQSMQ